MRRAGVLAVLSGLIVLGAGCSSKPPAGTGTPESRAQAATLVRDRELELTALRAEMATTRIAAAKKEAELQELRDLVQQLRLENAESRQASLEMRERLEQRQVEAGKSRDEQERLAQSETSQHLTVLKETVVTLVQAVGQLRQELAKPAVKERGKPVKPAPSKSAESQTTEPRATPQLRMPSAQRESPADGTMAPVMMSVIEAPRAVKPQKVTVQPGDTLWSLAKRHDTSVEVLRHVNAIENDRVVAGQVLALPAVPAP